MSLNNLRRIAVFDAPVAVEVPMPLLLAEADGLLGAAVASLPQGTAAQIEAHLIEAGRVMLQINTRLCNAMRDQQALEHRAAS